MPTVKFKIAVSSTEENGGPDRLYTLTLAIEAVANGFTLTPMGDVPLPKDPPKVTVEGVEPPQGDVPLPKDPPKVQITLPSQEVCTLSVSAQVEGESSEEIEVTAIEESIQDGFDIGKAA